MSAEVAPMESSTNIMALNDVTKHDIYSILERPINLGTFAWSSSFPQIPIQLSPTQLSNTNTFVLNNWDFPQALFANSPNLTDKLSRYQYLKADIEIEIKVNAQPFLQGALLLVYNPYSNQLNNFRKFGTRFLASQTSCPHKILSLEEGNSLKLICPYANIYDLFDLSNANNQFGTVNLYVFSQLKGAAASSVNYTVFARLVNPQFFVPTSKEINSALLDELAISRLNKRGIRFAQSDISPQAAASTGETQGPISGITSKVAQAADILSPVPVIGKVASTVSWISRIATNVATAFGLSKPVMTGQVGVRVIKPVSTIIHTEGQDDATTLALIQDNGIDGSSFIPEYKDEMALSYVFSRPNYFHSVTTDVAAFSGNKLITAWEISPFSRYQYGNTEDAATLFLGSFAYASMSMATLWRGTINFDVMVVKTPYHQGRFAIVVFPETLPADVPQTLGDLLTTNYNVVCNLKDRQDELGRVTFRVSVPFLSNTCWRETYKRDSTGFPDANTLDTCTGSVAIYSLVDLSAPPTVSDSVSFFIAHSGGEDYQVARPYLNLAPGYATKYAQSDVGRVVVPEDENLLVPNHITRDVTAQTTGEYFTSFRSIIKRFGRISKLSNTEGYISLRVMQMHEDFYGRREMRRGIERIPLIPSPFYMVSFLYRFFNGSVSNKALAVFNTSPEIFTSVSENQDEVVYTSEIANYGQPVFRQAQTVAGGLETRTPWYRGIRGDVCGLEAIPILGAIRNNYRLNASGEADLFEAAGDDFSYYFLVGPPPMCDISNVSLVNSVYQPLTVTLTPSTVTTVVWDQAYVEIGVIYTGFDLAYGGSKPFAFFADGTSMESINIVLNDATVITVPYQKMQLVSFGLPNYSVRLLVRVPDNINTAATLAGITAKANANVTY